jgi:hypothetical protein
MVAVWDPWNRLRAAILPFERIKEEKQLPWREILGAGVGLDIQALEKFRGVIVIIRERFAKRFSAGGEEFLQEE